MRSIASMFVAMAATVSFAGLLDNAWLKGTTDKDPLAYRPGEEMTFTLSAAAESVARPVTPEALATLRHSLIHRGDGKGRPDVITMLKAGTYRLAVSVGRSDGTPEISLPLGGQIGATRRYEVGKIRVK